MELREDKTNFDNGGILTVRFVVINSADLKLQNLKVNLYSELPLKLQ